MDKPYHILTPELSEALTADPKRRKSFLFLEDHPTLPLQWKVESFDATYLQSMEGTLTKYSTVSPFGFQAFVERAKEQGYEIVFMEDPAEILTWLASLDDPVGVTLLGEHIEGTSEEGFMPFQTQGINFAKQQRATYHQWSTGTGKSVGQEALIAWYIQQGLIDLVLYLVKTNNKINVARATLRQVGVPSVTVDGSPAKREKQYIEIARKMLAGEPAVLVTNHEKLRDDTEAMVMLVEDRRVLVIWDEMSSKFGNHTTSLYKGAAEVLYTSHTTRKSTKKVDGKEVEVSENLFYPHYGDERTAEVYHLASSATPIEHNPMNWFNQVRLMDSRVYGTRKNFEGMFIKSRDPWGNAVWDHTKLPLIGMMAAHMVHQVDKEDPDIAAQFPRVLPEETITLELSAKERWLYNRLVGEYEALKDQDASILDDTEILAAINVLQMICANPMAVLDSAKRFQAWLDSGGDPKKRDGSQVAWKFRADINDDRRFDVGTPTKIQALLDILGDEDQDEKYVVFTSLNDTVIPYISEAFDKAGIKHVVYHGSMTNKQKQKAEDTFQSDPSIRVFLSSDAGSDSINLHASAEVLHFDLPWAWSKKIQRQNRVNRIISGREVNRYRRLEMDGTFESRKVEVVAEKQGWHKGVFGGEINTAAQQMRRGDYLYIMLGDQALRSR